MDITEQLNKIESDERELLQLYRDLSEEDKKALLNEFAEWVEETNMLGMV